MRRINSDRSVFRRFIGVHPVITVNGVFDGVAVYGHRAVPLRAFDDYLGARFYFERYRTVFEPRIVDLTVFKLDLAGPDLERSVGTTALCVSVNEVFGYRDECERNFDLTYISGIGRP